MSKRSSYQSLATRRRFLRTGLLGAAAATSVPAFLERTFAGMHHAADAASAVQGVTGKDGTILVVVQLAGGNDGLNTVVPWADDAYYQARKKIAIPQNQVLKVNDQIGFAPAVKYFHEAFDNGELALVQGVGYPNPNRSHFRSTEIWEQATAADKTAHTGWLGRYFDNACDGEDPVPGIALTNQKPDSFVAARKQGITLDAPELYKWVDGGEGGARRSEVFDHLNAPDDEQDGASTGQMTSGVKKDTGIHSAGEALDFLERTALDARLSSDKVGEIVRKSKSKISYPGTPIGRNLQLISRMIEGGLSTRVYYASHGGFDTHNNQRGAHPARLGQLDQALRAFFKDLKAQGNYERVVLMTFSEFGRRVAENANAGTDHGAAAPLFLMGGGVKGGIVGDHPSLTDLHRGDLKFSVDFRSVYASLLEQWLGTNSEAVLRGKFKPLDLIRRG
ncbi:DUF1501 domain-containing protein [Sulfuriroseicoccus oceanibius]|uniref:DUF1501 domain-containing protein n=1 Tax=Sulfuriroseicoccus oceanibius TaxID=2707525 RepID=A0A6B3LFX7_9BACT|nr:DUF1501 domain-containing protein [Sulfuriroseicoccus oceanibius]QQL45664.1 DUF1501 domain-containing protein [Sulfuriroseicoccus oceanibius]